MESARGRTFGEGPTHLPIGPKSTWLMLANQTLLRPKIRLALFKQLKIFFKHFERLCASCRYCYELLYSSKTSDKVIGSYSVMTTLSVVYIHSVTLPTRKTSKTFGRRTGHLLVTALWHSIIDAFNLSVNFNLTQSSILTASVLVIFNRFQTIFKGKNNSKLQRGWSTKQVDQDTTITTTPQPQMFLKFVCS